MREPPPTIADAILGQIIFAGFMLLFVATPAGLVIPLKARGPDWDWQWSIILGAVSAFTFAAVGGASCLWELPSLIGDGGCRGKSKIHPGDRTCPIQRTGAFVRCH